MRTQLFQFLSTLPNPRSLEYHQSCSYVPKELPRLQTSVQHAPLRQLTLYTSFYTAVERPLVVFLDPEDLSIYWRINDNPGEPSSSFAHLYELVSLPLPKLVSLLLDIQPSQPGPDLNLHFLGPGTLRIFDYTLESQDTGVHDTIRVISSCHQAQCKMGTSAWVLSRLVEGACDFFSCLRHSTGRF
jgi:hypothetical protein